MSAQINGWYFGNILIGGAIGMLIVDPLTGAMWRIKERAIDASLQPKNISALTILDIKDVPETMRENLIKLN